MKTLSALLVEAPSSTQQEAHKLGVKYKGFGYWYNPQTGDITHKTENGRLVPVNDITDPGGGLSPSDGMINGGPNQNNRPEELVKNNQIAPGTNVGPAPEPGEEQDEDPEFDEWIPGPDGNHCVFGDEEKEELPVDTYVGRSNNPKWNAGPDGSNFKNLSFDTYVNEVFSLIVEGGEDDEAKAKKNQRNAKIVRNALKDNTRDISADAGTKTRAEIANVRSVARDMKAAAPQPHIDKWGRRTPGTKTKMDLNNLAQNTQRRRVDPNVTDTGGPKDRAARSALRKMGTTNREDALAGIERNRNFPNAAQRIIDELPAKIKDKDKTKRMNDEIRALVADPDYDMDIDNFNEIGSGSYGQVFLSKDGKNVIKKGQIGRNELAALHKMKDNPGFPTLINARYDDPFGAASSVQNNVYGRNLPNSQGNYVSDPYIDDDTAPGTFAMSKASGERLGDYIANREGAGDSLTPQEKMDMEKKFWKLRGQLHRAGLSHNDMHGGNIYYDEDSGNMSMLDLGLANDNPISALLEATGGLSKSGGDYQLTHHMRRGKVHPGLTEKMENNMNALENTLNEYGLDPGVVDHLLSGDIRYSKKGLDEFQAILDDYDIDPMELIQNLYAGIADDDEDGIPNPLDPDYTGPKVKNPQNVEALKRRMNKAMDNQSVLRRANNVRKGKGKPPLKLAAIATKAFEHDD